MALKGATWGTAVMYLFPSYMMQQYCKKQVSRMEKKEQLSQEQLDLIHLLRKEMPWIIGNAILGLIMGSIGTYRSLQTTLVN